MFCQKNTHTHTHRHIYNQKPPFHAFSLPFFNADGVYKCTYTFFFDLLKIFLRWGFSFFFLSLTCNSAAAAAVDFYSVPFLCLALFRLIIVKMYCECKPISEDCSRNPLFFRVSSGIVGELFSVSPSASAHSISLRFCFSFVGEVSSLVQKCHRLRYCPRLLLVPRIDGARQSPVRSYL